MPEDIVRAAPWRLLRRAAGASVLGALFVVRSQIRSARLRYAASDPAVHRVDLLVHPAAPGGRDVAPVELAAFGDSGMAGVGVRDVAQTLPAQIARRVADELGRPVHVVGHGRYGARTADVLTGQVLEVTGPVDVCVVMVGTNDVVRLTPWPRLARESDELLDALAGLGPVVLSSLPEFRAMIAVPTVLRPVLAARAVMVRCVQQRAVRLRPDAVLVDVRRAVGRRFVGDAATMSADFFHPSALGYGLIADVLAPAVVAAVSDRFRSERSRL